jgi:hypothetical protein
MLARSRSVAMPPSISRAGAGAWMMFSRQAAGTARHDHAELRRDDIEAFADILADLHPGAGPAAQICSSGSMTSSIRSRWTGRGRRPPGLPADGSQRFEPCLDGGKPRLNFLKGEGVLTVVELFEAAPASRALDGLQEELRRSIRACTSALAAFSAATSASSEEFDRRMSEIIAFKAAGSSGRSWRSPSNISKTSTKPAICGAPILRGVERHLPPRVSGHQSIVFLSPADLGRTTERRSLPLRIRRAIFIGLEKMRCF